MTSQVSVTSGSAENRIPYLPNIIHKIYQFNLLEYCFEKTFFLQHQGRWCILKMETAGPSETILSTTTHALFHDPVEDIMKYSDICNAMLRKGLQTPRKYGSSRTKPRLRC
jgi:hypothetical protein